MNIGKNRTTRANGMTPVIAVSRDRRDARPFTVPYSIVVSNSERLSFIGVG